MKSNATPEQAVLSYLAGKSSLKKCLKHFPWVALRHGSADSLARLAPAPHAGCDASLTCQFDVFSPAVPDLRPRGRSALAIVAADSVVNGFKDHLVYINDQLFSPNSGLSELCTPRLKAAFMGSGSYRIQAKTLLIDSVVTGSPRLASNVVDIEAARGLSFFLTLHRSSHGLQLELDAHPFAAA